MVTRPPQTIDQWLQILTETPELKNKTNLFLLTLVTEGVVQRWCVRCIVYIEEFTNSWLSLIVIHKMLVSALEEGALSVVVDWWCGGFNRQRLVRMVILNTTNKENNMIYILSFW